MERSARLATGLAGALLLFVLRPDSTAWAQPRGRPDEETLVAMQALIGSARCTQNGQCRSTGIGANPCGGPEQYLAWSTIATDADALQKLAVRYAEQRRKVHEQTGMSSVCMLFPEPSVRCGREEADPTDRCVLVPPAIGGGGGGGPPVR